MVTETPRPARWPWCRRAQSEHVHRRRLAGAVGAPGTRTPRPARLRLTPSTAWSLSQLLDQALSLDRVGRQTARRRGASRRLGRGFDLNVSSGSWTSITVAPSPMRSPRVSATVSVRRSPLTDVPQVEPRSCTVRVRRRPARSSHAAGGCPNLCPGPRRPRGDPGLSRPGSVPAPGPIYLILGPRSEKRRQRQGRRGPGGSRTPTGGSRTPPIAPGTSVTRVARLASRPPLSAPPGARTSSRATRGTPPRKARPGSGAGR